MITRRETELAKLLRVLRLTKPSPADEPLVLRREHGLRVPTAEQAQEYAAEWGTDKDSTDIALNLQMLYGQQFDTLRDEDWRDLAKAIQRYGDDREMAERERYSQQGE